MNIYPIKFVRQNEITRLNPKRITFCGDKISSDVFVNQSNQKNPQMNIPKDTNVPEHSHVIQGLTIYNPIAEKFCSTKELIDTTKPCKIYLNDNISISCVGYNPDFVGQIYDKNEKKAIDVCILKILNKKYPHDEAFVFISKDLQRQYGYVELTKDYKNYFYDEVKDDYPNEDIFDDRIVVKYLENYDDKNFGGVCKLADKLGVKFCLDNNIKPNIVSVAEDDSYIAHYSRGKRFVKPEVGSEPYVFLKRTYGTDDPNEILKELSAKHKRTGEKFDLSAWNNYIFVMYLPKELIEKYKEEVISKWEKF